MSGMKRLLDGGVSDDAARILRSADDDAPSEPETKQARIVNALDLGPSLGDGRRSLRSLFRVGAWTALAAFLALTTVLASRSSPRRTIVPANAPASPAPSPVEAPSSSSMASATARGVEVEDLPSVPERAAPARRPAFTATASAVEDELVAIDAARAALTSGKPEDALARIGHCRRQFPRPLYAEEADALEVQALAALGRRDEARAKAERFFSARPHSPYEPRVRAAIAGAQP